MNRLRLLMYALVTRSVCLKLWTDEAEGWNVSGKRRLDKVQNRHAFASYSPEILTPPVSETRRNEEEQGCCDVCPSKTQEMAIDSTGFAPGPVAATIEARSWQGMFGGGTGV